MGYRILAAHGMTTLRRAILTTLAQDFQPVAHEFLPLFRRRLAIDGKRQYHRQGV